MFFEREREKLARAARRADRDRPVACEPPDMFFEHRRLKCAVGRKRRGREGQNSLG
jgi:hypothetical protein